MSYSPLIKTIVDFFREGFSQKDELALVDLLWHFDARQKTLPLSDEINEALRIYQEVSLRRDAKQVYFVKTSLANDVPAGLTDDELRRAEQQYTKEFWKLYKQSHNNA